MTHQPKAGKRIDPEKLAAYIDQRLSPQQRAEVDAELATDPDAYAVFVDTVKALEVLDEESPRRVPDVRTVPFVPRAKVSARRTWIIGVGALAAAAAIVLAIWTRPDLLRRSPGASTVDPLIASLVDAVGDERYLEARLTGGFRHAAVRSVTRGPAASENLALLAAAGDLQKRVTASRTADSLHRWGSAALLVGRLDDAVQALEEAASLNSSDAAVLADLAAAYLARAQSGDHQEDLPRALDLATHAVGLNAKLPEASFNRALALEKLSLVDAAVLEWNRYLTIETDARWQDEGRQHLAALGQAQLTPPGIATPASLNELRQLGDQAFTRLVRSDASAIRAALEGDLLIEALRTPIDSPHRSSLFQSGVEAAQSLAQATGDVFPKETWVHAASAPQPALIAEGIQAYLDGRRLLRQMQVARAGEAFARGHRLLSSSKSPAVALTEIFAAQSAFQLGHTTEALTQVPPLLERFGEAKYTSLEGKAAYLASLCHLRFGQHTTVISLARRAAELAERAGDNGLRVSALLEVADAFGRLALTGDAWRERVKLLELAASLGDRTVSHLAFTSASRSASTEGHLSAARAFAEAMLRNAEEWKEGPAEADARLRLADIAYRLGETDVASGLLDDADRLLAGSIDRQADGAIVDVELLRAAVNLDRSPGEALAASDRALQILARRESPFRLARAKWLHGRALSTTEPEAARRSFVEGLEAADAEPTAVDPFGRSMADQRSALLRDLVRLPVEDAQARHVLTQVVAVLTGPVNAPALQSIQASMRPRDRLLVLLSLDDRLIRWVVNRDEVLRIDIRIDRTDLATMIKRFRDSLGDPESSRWEVEGGPLAEALLGPMVNEMPDRLLLVTDGLIAALPFSTLPLPSHRLVVDLSTIVILTSSHNGHRETRRPSGGTLVVGEPAVAASVVTLPRLPSARIEAEQVAGLYPSAHLMLGDSATKGAFLAQAIHADVIHFAGHALGNPGDPAMSRLMFAGGDAELTARDVTRQRISARIVVLGTCEGALSSAAGDSPIFGLTQAFLQAGVGSVIASTWKVADGAALPLLVGVHKGIVRGESAEQALRTAQEELRTEPRFSHPFFWAGFSVYSATP